MPSENNNTPAPSGSRRRGAALSGSALSLATALQAEVAAYTPAATGAGVDGSPVSTGSSGDIPVEGMAGECILLYVDDALWLRGVSVPGGLPPSIEGGCLGHRSAFGIGGGEDAARPVRGRWIRDPRGAGYGLRMINNRARGRPTDLLAWEGLPRVERVRELCPLPMGFSCDVGACFHYVNMREVGRGGLEGGIRRRGGSMPGPWAGVEGIQRDEGVLHPSMYLTSDATLQGSGGLLWVEGEGWVAADWMSRRFVG